MKFLVLCLVVAGTWQAVAAAPPAAEVEDQVAEVVDNAKEAVKTMAKQVMKPQDPRIRLMGQQQRQWGYPMRNRNPYPVYQSGWMRPRWQQWTPAASTSYPTTPNTNPINNLIQEVIATCDPKSCYVGCRMRQLGGGRCTKAGCLCYVAWTKPDGSPMGMTYREDSIWYTLSREEQNRIRMAKWQPRQPTARPTYAPTTRPTYAPTTVPTTTPTARPTYAPTDRPTYAPTTVPSTTPQPTARPDFSSTTTAAPQEPCVLGGSEPCVITPPAPTARPDFNPYEPPSDYEEESGFDDGFDDTEEEEDPFGGFGDDDEYAEDEDSWW